MIKKIIAATMAAMFAILFAFPAVAENRGVTVSVAYNAGYTNLHYNYFHTKNLTKPDYYVWFSVTDQNTETYYVDSSGNEYTGKHYTRVCNGTTALTNEKTVYFGQTVNFTNPDFHNSSDLVDCNAIRLRIRNGNAVGLGYKTKGTFSAERSNQPIQ